MAKSKSKPKSSKSNKSNKPESGTTRHAPAITAEPAASPTAASMAPGVDIGISDKDRKKISQDLGHFLSDSFTLYLKTHNFHWNVT
ncbi:MAG TPA: hypothetical protein PLD19_12350, partial [Luteimonas sp.]|nr:hypothetical protein [Luteimonas sp.]